jgi:Fe-S oxidoreductase
MLKVEEYKHQAETCVRCSYCKLIDLNFVKSSRFSRQCPIDVRYRFNLYSAHGLLHAALAELDGKLEFTPKLMDALWHCTLCGGCDIRCKRNLDVEVLQVIQELRNRCVEQGKGPMPEHKRMAENVRKSRNIYGAAAGERLKWMSAEVKPAAKADIVYFVGDSSAYRHPEIALATARLLGLAGVSFTVLKDEWSSGHELFATGQMDAARELAEHNVKAIQDSGARTVIASDAEVYKTLKVDYPRIMGKSTEDMPYTILHITEYIDQLMKDGKFKFNRRVPMKVTYHDPCNLGRLGEPWYHWEPRYESPNIAVGKIWRRGDKGVYMPPRDILNGIKGIELIEMERNKDNAWCCGYGGGVGAAFPDFALWTAGERVEEAVTTGAEAIVSGCPNCKDILGQAAADGGTGMKVYDITEIMLRAIR